MIDVNKLRQDFPILSREVHGKPLVYLDNAATTQKPRIVLDTIMDAYTSENANVHRGVHYLSGQMTNRLEAARRTVQEFVNAELAQEIIFTGGTTASVNLLAFSFGERFVSEGDEIIVSGMEHHSNLVPWQMMCGRKGAKLRIIPFSEEGVLDMDAYASLLNSKTKLVAVNLVSNTLGTVNPVRKMAEMAHEAGACILVDAAQAVQHRRIDVKKIGCDFLAFSGHKIYGPTGIGVLYGRRDLLGEMPPWQGGGEMVQCVSYEKTTYNELPYKFEAGTPPFVNAVGLAAALDYVSALGLDNIREYEDSLLAYATERLNAIKGLRIYGQSPEKSSVISFLVGKIHNYDMGMILDKMGVAVRTGHHCTEPIMDFYGIDGTVRASFSFYNTPEEIDILALSIEKAAKLFS